MEKLICQCCGMPLDEESFSREPSGAVNKEYCKYCYHDGEYKYMNLNDLIDFCVANFASEECPAEQMRAYMKSTLPKLNYWKNRN